MRRIFCFSRNCLPNSDTLGRFLVFAFWPGAAVRRSTAHFFDKQRSPLRKSLTFSPGFVPLALSRRHMRQTGPVYRAITWCSILLNAAPLRRPDSIVRDRRDILNEHDF